MRSKSNPSALAKSGTKSKGKVGTGTGLRTLPPAHVVDVAPPSWLLPNRVGFPDWVAKTFKYDHASTDPRSLFIHQRFVRDYLQPASPYRGLLLFHGLGVGKTCASIAIADVLSPPTRVAGDETSLHKKVFVMLPAFLRGNFVTEVMNCGDPRFSANRTWRQDRTQVNLLTKQGKTRKVPPVPRYEAVPVEQGGVPFPLLPVADREAITAQIQADIIKHYTVIHYNGLSVASVAELCEGTTNVFSDSVVIIDEAPNVIGQVMHNKLMANVYQRMMDADRCKIVLLSGTPLVNDPRELAYIANLVHGYIREVSLNAVPKGVDVPAVVQALSDLPFVDHVTSELLADGSKIIATMLPRGFQRLEGGVGEVIAYEDAPTIAHIIAMLRTTASSAAGVPLKDPELVDKYLLPIDDHFKTAFIAPSATGDDPTDVMNGEILVRRLMGTVSVYTSTDPTLMPTILPAKVVRLPMSGRQYEQYLLQREVERRKERTAARFAARAKASGSGATSDSTNLYRAFSRSVCTFVFPEGIDRPYRSDQYKSGGDVTDLDGEEDTGTEAGGLGDGTSDQDGYDTPTDTRLAAKKQDRVYDDNLNTALARIYEDRTKLLTLSGELPILSPKYAALITHLLEPANARKPAIIYSQFRRVEGLGLLSMALISNGFVEIRVTTKAGVVVAEAFPPDAAAKAPRFIVYGNDDGPAATAMLQIFNSKLDKLPASVSSSLARILAGQPGALDGSEGNRHGAIARLLLITQSGSEGISTRNVREVHIVEPFWHANRILQVVGRAARNNSHEDLPKDERTIEVKVYVATLTTEQASHVTITKLDKKLTSDEHILGVATRKRALLDRFTDVMRRTAVDCALHHPVSAARRCFAHPAATLRRGPAALSFHTDLQVDIASQGRHIRLVPFQMDDGHEALADPVTGNVYDRTTYTQTGRLRAIGTRRPSSVVRRVGISKGSKGAVSKVVSQKLSRSQSQSHKD